MAKLLEVKDMRFAYGKTEVIHGISFDIEEGEIVTLIGANGAGKSTTLNTLAGLQRVSAGTITFRGNDISKKPPEVLVKEGIVLVPEGRQIFPAHTVEENLLLGAYTERNNATIKERMEEMFELFPRLRERRTQFGGTLSGGEQQMLAIARAMMTGPKLIMLDEPSLGLAPIIVDEVMELLASLKSRNLTVLLVEQMANQALEIADRAYVLETGNMVMGGTSEEVANDPRVIEAYLGNV